jgi:hypothetical protein
MPGWTIGTTEKSRPPDEALVHTGQKRETTQNPLTYTPVSHANL